MISKLFLELAATIPETHKAKNAGYSGDNPDPWANFRRSEEFGVEAWRGCLIRMSDKFSRLISLAKNPDNEQVGESFEDTAMDLANYSIILVCLHREHMSRMLADKVHSEV